MASILVVDDDAEVGDAIRRVLERAGFDVSVSSSAEDALEVVGQRPPDVIITDIIMPKLNGLELLKILRERHPRIQVIAISGGGSLNPSGYKPDAISTHAFLAAAHQAGAGEVLTKPFEVHDILAAVRRLLPN
jgi:CheY-like chemotaxis protein